MTLTHEELRFWDQVVLAALRTGKFTWAGGVVSWADALVEARRSRGPCAEGAPYRPRFAEDLLDLECTR